MNTEPLKELIAFLRDSPKSLTMGTMARADKKTWSGSLHAVLVKIKNPRAFARIVKETDYFKQWKAFETEAARILDIDQGQADKLFAVMSWPDKLRTLREKTDDDLHLGYWEIDDPVQMAELVTNRVRAFIESKGKQ